jgi:catechol O-methyltransferase
VEVFYKLASRDGKRGGERHVRDLVDAVKKERIDIWVNCHGGDVDLEVKEVLEREMRCKVLQFPTAGMKLLGDEVAFGEHVKKLGLNVAERHLVSSEEEIPAILYPEILEPSKEKQYTAKSASTNDTTSSEMTLLLLSSPNDIKGCLKTLQPSPSHPLILQESFPNH